MTKQTSKKTKQTPADAFTDWLRAMPSGFDNREHTIPMNVTLPLNEWLFIAQAASVHNQSIEGVVSDLLMEGTDNLPNVSFRYQWEVEKERDEMERAEKALAAGGAK